MSDPVSSTIEVTCKVHTAWWLKPYLAALVFFCRLHATEPEWDRVRRVIHRAITVKFEGAPK